MKTRTRFLLAVWLISLILSACGSSQAEHEAQLTQIAANDFSTQTAQAPTDTATPEPTATAAPTATATMTPTPTEVPTETPDPAKTAMAATHEAAMATINAKSTADVLSTQQAQQAEADLWTRLEEEGSITLNQGDLHQVDDFEQSWAQRGWYQWWSFGYDMSDFVIMTHIEWKSAQDTNLAPMGGCGFAVRIQDESKHLVVFLTTGNMPIGGQMTSAGWKGLTVSWQDPEAKKVIALSGSADFIAIVENERVTIYIDGKKAAQYYTSLTGNGDIGYTVISGTNKDFGTSCTMTGTRVWELVK